jgi:hypothetical protein
MARIFRSGSVGAILDEYERAVKELQDLLQTVTLEEFTTIVDKETKDPDCVSIQTIMNHTIRAGFGYANYIRTQFGEAKEERKENYGLVSPESAIDWLSKMMAYTDVTLQTRWNITFDEVIANSFKVSWGQTFDFEQLWEHAIVHILRHRRQIEKFLIIQRMSI